MNTRATFPRRRRKEGIHFLASQISYYRTNRLTDSAFPQMKYAFTLYMRNRPSYQRRNIYSFLYYSHCGGLLLEERSFDYRSRLSSIKCPTSAATFLTMLCHFSEYSWICPSRTIAYGFFKIIPPVFRSFRSFSGRQLNLYFSRFLTL